MDKPKKQEMFEQICSQLTQTYIKKNHDYGDSFGKLFDKYGMPYALSHLEEKLMRIETLQTKPNAVENESFIDSLRDLVNYGIMTLVEIEINKIDMEKNSSSIAQ